MYLASYLTLLPINMQRPAYRHMLRLLIVGAALCFISACGFHVRGNFQVPENLTEVSVQGNKRSDVAMGLQRALTQRDIHVVPYTQGTPVIEVGQEQLVRRILSLTPSGQVAEYEFVYTLPIRFVHTSGQAQEQTIELSRDYQDDPNFALAKTREFELVIREMRSDAVQRALILMNQYLRN